MSTRPFPWIPAALLALACQAPAAHAQSTPGATARLHANAVASFRQARFPEAYGRLISLANAGHAPSAELALWMYANGPVLLGKDWDATPEQLAAWAQLAGQPVPTMVASSYPAPSLLSASRSR